MGTTEDLGLFVDKGPDLTIVDHGGRTYTPAEARDAWEAGRVRGYNLAFLRLAVRCDFDLDRLREYDAEHQCPAETAGEGSE